MAAYGQVDLSHPAPTNNTLAIAGRILINGVPLNRGIMIGPTMSIYPSGTASSTIDLLATATTFDPASGMWVSCQGNTCNLMQNGQWGSFVEYRTLPPAGPGPCTASGAFSVDENGYVYFCSPAWWSMSTNAANPAVNNSVWIRSPAPFVSTWTPDRPAGQPAIPTTTGGQ
jgi:hypothetical protein